MTAGDEEHDTTRTATVHIQTANDQLVPLDEPEDGS